MNLATSSVSEVIAGMVAAAVISWLAYRRGALTSTGAVAATLVGIVVVVAGGWAWGGMLVTFFVTSSALSLWRERRRPGNEITARGHRRDAVQVIANGGFATLAAILASTTNHNAAFGAFAGAIAAATADTWATEIGGMAGRQPRLITNGQLVSPGTSGGITVPGCLGSIAGAALIGSVAALAVDVGWIGTSSSRLEVVAACLIGGTMGSAIDSLLGATVQLQYACPRCQARTERKVHGCGTPTQRVRGLSFVTNDTVNGAATVTGGFAAALIMVV